ncbi:hypothetical protein FJZ17_02580 [Candidatus Pacearchaeota archaeon]|nr:hypothetical protein [Candidatus Pacearchaeota archaeon]
MGFKEGVRSFFYEKSKPRTFNIILIVLICLGLIFLIINYLFLFTKFSVGDFVYTTQGSLKVGQIEGINTLTGNYLVKWNSGEFSDEFFWNLNAISELEGYELSSLGLNDKKSLKQIYSNFQKEDNFKNYVVSSSGNGTLIYDDFGFNFTTTKECKPSYSCSDWGFCQAKYTLTNILENNLVIGIQYRYCRDDNSCLPNLLDSQDCVLEKEITTREKIWCNKRFIEVLDTNGTVLARLDNGINTKDSLPQNYLDIKINLLSDGYCPYCFNNKKDYDETGRDCGGSCIPCGQIKK